MSPLRDAWLPGGEDDRETQEIVSRMLTEIRLGGEEVRQAKLARKLIYKVYISGLQKLCTKAGRLHWEYCPHPGRNRRTDQSNSQGGVAGGFSQ